MSVSDIRTVLASSLIERDAEIEALLLGLVAGEHVMLVGPPGTGKSLLCRSLAAAIDGCQYVERLLSPTLDPDHLWGPIDPVQYRESGRYVHITDGYLPSAHIAFLDEFFRGSPAIRDTLLHLLGPERQALIDGQQVRVPLRLAVGAANSWDDSADQAAVLDRWLIRREVRPVSPAGRERLAWAELPAVQPVCTLADVDAAHQAAMALPVSGEAKATYGQILSELAAEGIQPSDRRVRLAVKVARAAAVLDGADTVQPRHLEPLGDVLWDTPGEQAVKAAEIVTRLANPVGARVNELLREVDQVVRDAGGGDAAKRMAAIKKLEECERQAGELAGQGNGRAAKALEYVRRERVRLQAAALGIDPDRAAALLGGGVS